MSTAAQAALKVAKAIYARSPKTRLDWVRYVAAAEMIRREF